jgi:hypothetical protein
MTAQSLARDNAGASRAVERKAATDGRRRLALAMILDPGVRTTAAAVYQIGLRQLDTLHVGIAEDFRPGISGSRQQEPIEVRTQHLVAIGNVRDGLKTVPCNRRYHCCEFLDVSFTLSPPDGVSRCLVEIRAIDRVEDADLREQLAGARRQRLRRPACRVDGPGQHAHRVAPLREQARDGRSGWTSADHDDVDVPAHRFGRLLGIRCGLSRDIFVRGR